MRCVNLRSLFVAQALLFVLGAVGCKHDLDALKSGTPGGGTAGGSGEGSSGTTAGGGSGSGSSGEGASGIGSSGSGSSGEGASGSGASGTGGDACECDDPKPVMIGSVSVTPEVCCYGSRGTLCGVKFEKDDTCYPADLIGEPDTACDAEKGTLKQAGCCRPDAQCGVQIDAFDLGCVALQDVPKPFGGPGTAATCKPACDDDKDCSDFSSSLICVEDKTHNAAARSCATTCERDADCKDNVLGERCMLFKNIEDDRLDQYCGAKVGPVLDGETCGSNEDCVHGLCVRVMPSDTQGYCTRLCGGVVDCEQGQSCMTINAATPATMTPQTVRICLGN